MMTLKNLRDHGGGGYDVGRFIRMNYMRDALNTHTRASSLEPDFPS